MIGATLEESAPRARPYREALPGAQIVDGIAYLGGGSLPQAPVAPSLAIALASEAPDADGARAAARHAADRRADRARPPALRPANDPAAGRPRGGCGARARYRIAIPRGTFSCVLPPAIFRIGGTLLLPGASSAFLL